jgi:ADP-heptose:LPS heptosyltransferase
MEDSRSIAGILRVASAIRTLRPDLAISLSHPRRNALLAYLSRAPRLAGYLSYRNTLTPFRGETTLESFGCAMRSNVMFGAEPIGERAGKILDLMDIPRASLADSPIGEGSVAQSVHRSRGHGVAGLAAPYVVLHPFSGWEYRNWPLDRFAVLARHLCGEERMQVVFIYESRDAPRMNIVRNELEAVPGIHFLPSDDLTRTAEVVAGAGLFVGNDSGPLHLAALLGIPAVGLFGPASPEFTAPPNMRGSACFHRLPCSPCDQRRCVRPADPCMTYLSIGLVFDAVRPLLHEPAGSSGGAHA